MMSFREKEYLILVFMVKFDNEDENDDNEVIEKLMMTK